MSMNQASITDNGSHPLRTLIGWRPPVSDCSPVEGLALLTAGWNENYSKKLTGMYCDYEIKSREKRGIAASGRSRNA